MPGVQACSEPISDRCDRRLTEPEEIQQAFAESRTLERLRAAGQKQLSLLSHRELEVLRQVASGFPNKTIASCLKISIKTVEKYRGSLMRKLQVRTLPDLMRIWLLAHPHELNLQANKG